MVKNFNKKVFILVFMLIVVFFAAGETVLGLLPYMREKNRICQNAKEQLINYTDQIFDWLGEIKIFMEEGRRSKEEIYDELFDALGMLKAPEGINIRAILYTGGDSDAFAYWNLLPAGENDVIFDFLTDVKTSPFDGSRWISLDENDAVSLWQQISVDPIVSKDITTAGKTMEPALCGTGHESRGDAFVAYVPMSGEQEALAAMINPQNMFFLQTGILREGYGYSLVKHTSLGNVVLLSDPYSLVYETGDIEIDLPGGPWYLDVYPLHSVISVPRIGLELVVSVLGAALAAVLAAGRK